MERLRPIDLERMNLPVGWRGYRRQPVDEALTRAAREIETLLGELKEAREIADKALKEADTYRAQENLMKEALILAQKAADETRAAASREAEMIVETAKRAEAELRAQAETRISDLRWDIERLSLDRQRFEQRFRALLEDHLSGLGDRRAQPPLVNLEVNDEAV